MADPRSRGYTVRRAGPASSGLQLDAANIPRDAGKSFAGCRRHSDQQPLHLLPSLLVQLSGWLLDPRTASKHHQHRFAHSQHRLGTRMELQQPPPARLECRWTGCSDSNQYIRVQTFQIKKFDCNPEIKQLRENKENTMNIPNTTFNQIERSIKSRALR